jgi:alpha-L-rhamnosidase
MPTWIRVAEESVPPVGQRPVYLVRREFSIGAVPASASLRISAHGVYTAYLNGRRIGTDEFTPGYTDYRHHTQFQTYQVGDLLEPGNNVLAVELSDGWYRGAVGIMQHGDQYGTGVELWAEVTDDAPASGTAAIISTDASWRSGPTHILSADMFQGQNEDLRLRNQNSYLQGFDDSAWAPMLETGYDGELFAQASESNRVVEYIRPRSIRRLGPTTQVVDFGQNLNGWVRLSKLGAAGTKITLTHGEWTDANGDVTTSHLDVNFPIFPNPIYCHQVDTVISDGLPHSIFEPRFTTHGFQFVRVEGLAEDLTADDIASAAVHADLRRIGHFKSSDERLNWLHDASVWSFRGNALDLPTDCPTRERSGWTGDWQLYAETAAFLYDVREFNRKFLADVRLIQEPGGKVLNIAPFELSSTTGIPGNANGSSGWGDVVVQAPLVIYQQYGETDQLEESFESMTRWVEFGAALAASGRHPSREGQAKTQNEDFLWDSGYHWGEWMEPGAGEANPEFDFFAYLNADKGLVATSYLYRSARDTAEIARVLGKPAEVIARLKEIAERAKLAWAETYLNSDGSLTEESQANYARTLAFGLFPEHLVAAAAAKLNELVAARGYRLGTGFLTTPMLLPVLADHGYLDTAYRLLFQNQEPSWLVMRDRGATTIWEQWHGVDKDGAPHESLNHYSKGAVISFLHQYTAGLKPLAPGYSRFAVSPMPTPEVEWIELSLESPVGLIEVEWRQRGGVFSLEVTVPAGAEAEITLPNGQKSVVSGGSHVFEA